jgi:tetratricopeptide (TPR) repeat protein
MNQVRKISGILTVAALLALIPQDRALSKESLPLPVTHGTLTRDSARITFEWPQTVYFTAKTSGKNLTITFDRKANPDFATLLRQLSPYITHAERKADGKTIVLALDKPYRIRTFVSDNINGVDLIGIDPNAKHKSPVKEMPQIAQAKPALAPVAKAPPKSSVVEYAASEESASAFAKLAPAAGEETPAAPVSAPHSDNNAMPEEEIKKILPVSDKLKVSVSAAQDSAVLRLPFADRMAMAVFVRNHALWMAWNTSTPLDLSDFDALPQTVVGKAQLLKTDHGTVLRMPVDDGVFPAVAKEKGSNEWAVLLTAAKRDLSVPIKLAVNTEPPAPPHVFVSVLETTDPIKVTDPQIGDEIVITPLFNLGEGVSTEREFVDFILPSTAQGFAVVKKTDEVTVAQLRNGLRVGMARGTTLTPGLPEVVGSAGSAIGIATLFPYDLWKIESTTNSLLYSRALFHSVVESENPQEANEARLRLAQFYMGQGQAVEAIGLLDGINRTNPSYYRSSKLSALRGAANFLMYRFVDAAKDFSASELNNNKEIEYWRNTLGYLLGAPDKKDSYLDLNADYFSKYPPILRQRLAIVAADRAIAAKEYSTALKIFDTLHQDNLTSSISSYVNFLLAKVSADTGQTKEAQDMWDKLAVDSDHPFVQARAEFSRIVWGMEHNTLTKDQAADRLERLRLSWHGDNLELQVITLLGEIYSENNDYLNAMRIWHGGIQSFPNTAVAIDMTREMQEAFIKMFNADGISNEMPPIDALALYYEYRSYTPPGNTGDEMMERLAERLVSVDLLDQAASLLDHQMKFQAEKEKRSRIGTKLATVYLLNKQPKKALNALEESVYGENPLLLRLYRNRLTAQAMADMGQSDKALQTLGQDTSPEAEQIRLDVYWKERDWGKVANSVEQTLKARPDAAAPITLDESESLLRLALAYVFQNDTAQVQYLHDYFGPLMKDNPNKPVFDFVTAGDVPLTTRNFDEVIERLTNTRSFIENYKARIETAGLATAAVTSTP